ncbi:phosphate ABC transporter permease subunit PstC [Catellatospora tritici]|uniref:phosphate ABC transporter permease subunit PstC n=1 Tax=Catellatospora tritici TaxID=2851566 RepID=UPI0027E019AF|nr:phosphate ABC transporter permease subunit PstC [Catellatospora tritici]
MTASVQVQPTAPDVAEQRRELAPPGGADRVFRLVLRSMGSVVLGIMAVVGLFLAIRAGLALRRAGGDFLTTEAWEPDDANFGVAAVLVGTILIALVAISLAVPLATGMALYISEYATGWRKRLLVTLVDLMAAVPSVVYGLWGVNFLQPRVVGLSRWLATYGSWIPLLEVDGYNPGDPLSPQTVFTSSTFIAGIVVALMVTPIISSIMREVFSQAPVGEREGAYALGGTRWGMIRTVVLPFGRGGMIGGTMLGLGRAMGETIAIYMIISPVFVIQPHILENGASSISSLIALKYGAAGDVGISALMAAGLTLFVVTLAVNFGASMIIARSRSGAQSEV